MLRWSIRPRAIRPPDRPSRSGRAAPEWRTRWVPRAAKASPVTARSSPPRRHLRKILTGRPRELTEVLRDGRRRGRYRERPGAVHERGCRYDKHQQCSGDQGEKCVFHPLPTGCRRFSSHMGSERFAPSEYSSLPGQEKDRFCGTAHAAPGLAHFTTATHISSRWAAQKSAAISLLGRPFSGREARRLRIGQGYRYAASG